MTDITKYGFLPSETMPAVKNGMPARVTAVHKERYGVVCEHGQIYAKLKTRVYFGGNESFPTVGDFVYINYNLGGDSLIVKTLRRKSVFVRREPGTVPRQQALAANFDYVFITASLNYDLNLRRIERYLAIAAQGGGTPVILLTKADLAENPSAKVQEVEKVSAGAKVYAVSAKTGFGIGALSEFLEVGKTIVFLGSSGVGKSSLVNVLAGEEIMTVNGIREDDSKGRHTTTHRQLIMLKSGVMLIDTPGIRELAVTDISDNLCESFADVSQYFGKCKFADCRHQGEPGCAVVAALESGKLLLDRWQSYLKLNKEAKYSGKRLATKKGGKIKERGGETYDGE